MICHWYSGGKLVLITAGYCIMMLLRFTENGMRTSAMRSGQYSMKADSATEQIKYWLSFRAEVFVLPKNMCCALCET